ncbi:MAG: hypothetical protein ACI9MF_002658, partial [Gammaproteobacteria bacterium]
LEVTVPELCYHLFDKICRILFCLVSTITQKIANIRANYRLAMILIADLDLDRAEILISRS